MPRYKLFRLFETLSKPERIEAERHVAGKKHQDCMKIFSQLKKMKPETMISTSAKQALFTSSFPGLAYDDTRMRKLMTYLTQMLEDFLIQKELSTDLATRQHLLSRSLSRRSDYGLFKECVEQRLQTLEEGRERGMGYFKEKAQLFQSLYFHPETPKYGNPMDYFSLANESQKWHLVQDRLLFGTESLARKRVLGREDSQLLYETAKMVVARSGDCPAVISFFNGLDGLLRLDSRVADLPQLKASLLKVFDFMERQEQQMALKLLVLYATPFSNNGDLEHSHFVFDLYRLGIERHLLQRESNAIETILFMNVAFVGARLGELDWTANFIKIYEPCLPKDDRPHAINLCQGVWHYNNGLRKNDPGEFDQAMRLLNLVPTRSDEKFDLRVRSLQLRIQFDAFRAGVLPMDNVLEQARNFERHLQTSKVYSNEKNNSYFAFIKHVRCLTKLANKPETSRSAVLEFLSKLQSDHDCTLRHWLEEKAERLLPAPLD